MLHVTLQCKLEVGLARPEAERPAGDMGRSRGRLQVTQVCMSAHWLAILKVLFLQFFVILRFGNTGSLSVKEMSASQKPPPRTSKSPGTANVLDVNNSTLMFVGGLGGQIKVTFRTSV